jgi:NADPH-dependent ferric siderophore reductase
MPSAPKWLFDTVDLLMPKLPSTEVDDTKLLSPSVKKIRFKGDFGKLSIPVGAYIDFRVSDTQARRYTVSHADIANGMLECIIHLHGNGSGQQFMGKLRKGDKIDINKPRGERKYYDRSAGRFVIFGDETSLGLACSFLPVLKENSQPFQFYFELDEENNSVPGMLGLEHYTVFPKSDVFRKEARISELPVIQAADWQRSNFVLTGNVKSAQTFRKVIKEKTQGKIYLHGYWLEGKKGL